MATATATTCKPRILFGARYCASHGGYWPSFSPSCVAHPDNTCPDCGWYIGDAEGRASHGVC